MKLPPHLEAKILATPGVVVNNARRAEPDHVPEAGKAVMIEPRVYLDGAALVIEVPVETRSESNQREWRKRSARTKSAWTAVSKTVGPYIGLLGRFAAAYARGDTVYLTFTRLGGRRLDRMANLGSAMKAAEDAMAYIMGCDDGDPRWVASSEQEPGGACGVRIMLSLEP